RFCMTVLAPGKHAFVTEYAGASTVMQNLLDAPGRFGSTSALRASPNVIYFVEYLQQHGFAFTGQLNAILARYIPEPAKLAQKGVSYASWLQSLSYYLSDSYRQTNAADFAGWPGVS